VLALPNNFLLARMSEQFKEASINVRQVSYLFVATDSLSKKKNICREYMFISGITLTTHEVVATLAHFAGSSAIDDLILLVDEVDMCSPANEFGFKGAEHFMRAKFFYGCSATALTEADKKEFKCPDNAIFNDDINRFDNKITKELKYIED